MQSENINRQFLLKKNNSIQFTVLLTVILILSFIIRVVFINNFRWDYDEGIHVLLAQLLAMGYMPYSELFISYPPVFVWSLEWPWRMWSTIQSIQLLMTLYALLGVAAVGIIAYKLEGKLAGVLAATFLSLALVYIEGSRAVMTEVPSIGMATLSVALAANYYWTGKRGWLFVSGLAMSASLMLKVLSPFVLGLIPLMIFVRQIVLVQQPQTRLINGAHRLVTDGVIWGVGLLLPILFTLFLYDAEAMYRQIILFRMDSRIAYQEDWSENIEMLVIFVQSNLALILLAVWGAILVILNFCRNGWFLPVWLVFAVAFSLVQVPLREKHLPLLLPPLAILAGLALAFGLSQFRKIICLPRNVNLRAVFLLLLTLFLSLGYIWQLKIDFDTVRQTTTTPLNDDRRMLVEYLQKFSSPDDCIVTDDPTLAFFAQRRVPPNLSEVSSARLRSGYLTYDELVSATEAYNCQIVAPTARRLKRTRPDFIEWAKQNYQITWLYDGATEVMLAKPLLNVRPQHPLNIDFTDQVKLLGYDLSPVEDNQAYLSLYWQPLASFEQDYTVFVHVRDNQNNTIINADHQPYDGRVPTTRWPVKQILKETIRLDVPESIPTGEYQIKVGMYSPVTLERLSIQNDVSGENAVDFTLSVYR